MKYPIGTLYLSRGKHKRLCKVIDYHVTTNLTGEIVRRRYVATNECLGQIVTDADVPESSVAMGVFELQQESQNLS